MSTLLEQLLSSTRPELGECMTRLLITQNASGAKSVRSTAPMIASFGST
jgi:hypothetical protein